MKFNSTMSLLITDNINTKYESFLMLGSVFEDSCVNSI